MSVKKRVIITGATGFIGSNLTRRLLKEGHNIHLLVRRGYKKWRLEAICNDVYLHEVDFIDRQALTHVISHIRPDWVFHLAAYGAYSWQNDLSRMIETNITGTVNLVEACLKTGFEAFINTGTSSEYGFKDHAVLETECLEPNSHYALTKAYTTLFCRYTAGKYGVRMPTLRLYSVYGPYEEPARLIPTLIVYGLNGGFPPLVKPEVSRDFVYIEDVEKAYLLAATEPDREPAAVYNVGTGIQISMRVVVEIAKQAMGITMEPEWETMPGRNWDTNVWVADNRRIQQELGWQPSYTFEQGFRKTVAWFRENPALLAFYQKVSREIYKKGN